MVTFLKQKSKFMTTTQKTVGAGAMLLFLIAGLGHAGFFDRFTPEKTTYIEGVELTANQVTHLIDKTYQLKEVGKLYGLVYSSSSQISPDDWELFRQVIVDPSRLSNVGHIGALIRLLRTTKDPRLQEILKELLCSALPEICEDLSPTEEQEEVESPTGTKDPTLEEVTMSVRLYNVVKVWASRNGDLQTLREVIEAMAEKGDGVATYTFLRERNAGKKGLEELKEIVEKVHPDLINLLK